MDKVVEDSNIVGASTVCIPVNSSNSNAGLYGVCLDNQNNERRMTWDVH